MTSNNYSLFNATDEWILTYVDEQAFEESLLMNVLFQEQILMHESYFFNSRLLGGHIARSKGSLSLFECAARKGLVVPAIRDRGVASLEHAYESLSRGSFYRNYQLVPEEMKPYILRIIGAVDRGLKEEDVGPFYWPEPDEDEKKLGLQYLKLLRQVFQAPDPPGVEVRSEERKLLFRRVWNRTSRWRYETIEEAARRTQRNGNIGLQRMELMRAMGWSVGIPRSTKTVNPSDLMSQGDEETKLTTEIFIKWLAQCHHLVQARIFGTRVNFPVYDIDNDFLLDSIFINDQDQWRDKNREDSHVLRVTVKLPPVEALIRFRPQELIAVRNDLGLGYRVALRRWESDPSEENRELLRASLTDYCDRLSANYSQMYLEPLVAEYVRAKARSWSPLARQSVGLAASGVPGSGLFIGVGRLLSATYRYVTQRKRRRRLLPSPEEIELNLRDPSLL